MANKTLQAAFKKVEAAKAERDELKVQVADHEVEMVGARQIVKDQTKEIDKLEAQVEFQKKVVRVLVTRLAYGDDKCIEIFQEASTFAPESWKQWAEAKANEVE